MKKLAMAVAMFLLTSGPSLAEDSPSSPLAEPPKRMPGDADSILREITCKALSLDKKLLAVYYREGWDEVIAIREAKSGKELHTLVGHGDNVTKLQFSPDGKTLAARVINKNRQGWAVWDVETGELQFRLLDDGRILED